MMLDGHTAPCGETIEAGDDQKVAEEIISKLPDGCDAMNLIGMEYAEKIALCQNIDVFMASGGTNAVVPLRFCKKPGIVHSNKDLRIFERDTYDPDVMFIDKSLVKDVFTSDKRHRDHTSYSIDVNLVYRDLQKVMQYAEI